MTNVPFSGSPEAAAGRLCAAAWLIGSLVLIPAAAHGLSQTIHLEAAYSGTAAAFNLYKNGALVCQQAAPTPGPRTTTGSVYQMDCTVTVDPIPMTFVLTAVDHSGVESPQSAPYVLPPPLVATFTAAPATPGAATVSFDAAASLSPYGDITSYAWDFGDGTRASGRRVSHTYRQDGDFTVVLVVTDSNQGTSRDRLLLSVLTNTPPTAVNQRLQVPARGTKQGTLAARDPDNDPLTFSLVSRPRYGSIVMDPKSGKFLYQPTSTRFFGLDSFTFTASDGKARSNVATVVLALTRAR